ncbi:MAG: hypothetical protein U0984_12550 [Prosthecobacter sp.]|nr:hypothetical protein [Prosthecobacter sp.]
MLKSAQFVTDQKGKRVGVMLDLKTYERLLDAAEDAADIRTYRKARPKILAQVARGDAITLADYRTKRGRA